MTRDACPVSSRRAFALLALLAAALFVAGCGGSDKPASSGAASGAPANGSASTAAVLAQDTSPQATYSGMQHLHYRFGPVHLAPGQNLIKLAPIEAASRPAVPGYITAFRPNLTYVNGKVPRVDVVHLHHGVWLVDGAPQWASGEEKSYFDLPKGFGWRYTPQQTWLMNHMIHDLIPKPADVYVTWDIDFVPDSSPAAATIKPARTQWMDVAGPAAYPVFDATRKAGRKAFTFPGDQAVGAPGPAHEWVVPQDQTLLWDVGHLHPGGIRTDLTITRDGKTVPLFRSKAKYYEPAGPVSWDVAMTATKPDWRVKVKKGDVIKLSGTYDVSENSWYESMAINFLVTYAGTDQGGIDPFSGKLDPEGAVTHGHLAENDNHGGDPAAIRNASKVPSQPSTGSVALAGFLSSQGDLRRATGALPAIHRGSELTFVNRDATRDIFHTITGCRLPCNESTGIAYPRADGPVDFDSGELGIGPKGFTAASGRVKWSTPATLPTGTYTYFCRIHPFMRGGFRVVN